MTLIIGLTGYAQHGKDTVGAEAVEHFGFRRMAFADPVRQLAYLIDPLIDLNRWRRIPEDEEARKLHEDWKSDHARLRALVDHFGWERAKHSKEVRRFLQQLGTRCREVLGQDVWVNVLRDSIEPTDERVVITDARFPNEFAFIKRAGTLLRVNRTNADGTPFDNGIGTEHESERHIASAPADFDIVCESNVLKLQAYAHDVIASVVVNGCVT